ncbi:fungal protein [Schizosaccharomyces japonicus yFS275]|uniref:Fungal protein n=1 Tax=Schizosaccharomyces japonicus (strain yFS275 / FY16936) TaxID=402676 RepID=B6K652_SCHJY|nr:fungal protein [Schizosaccharomyces japonicus yFS275]EEB09006.1 fungal protein [Schizosaccharomyces japonicus yFS275]
MAELDVLLSAAKEKLLQSEVSEALSLAEQATKLCTEKDSRPYELLGEVFAEQGEFDKAKAAFEESIRLAKSSNNEDLGYEKYLWMAQMGQQGEPSLELYNKGISILEILAQKQQGNADELAEIRKKLVGAYCGIAELFMTDLCMREDAEQQCEHFTDLALKMDPSSAEALQTFASMRISQQRVDDAKAALKKCIDIIFNAEPDVELPVYAVRTSIAKLLIEIGMHDEAHQLLMLLQKEDDQIVDTWYLLGWNCYVEAEELQENSAPHEEIEGLLVDARSYFLITLATYEKTAWDDEGILNHTKEVLSVLDTLNLPSVDESGAIEEAIEEEWETSEDEMEEDH